MTDKVLVSVVIKKVVKNLKRMDFVGLDNIKNLWANLARYLEMMLTTLLFAYLEDAATEVVLKEWLNSRSSGFEVLSWETRAQLEVSKLWMMLAYKWVPDLLFKILSLQPSDIKQDELNKVLTYAMIIHVMMCLIHAWLDMYHESADSAQEHQKVEMYVGDNWFHAFNVLWAYYQDNTSAWFFPGRGCRSANIVIPLYWSQVTGLVWGPVTIVTGMVNKSGGYDYEIVKNDDKEKDIEVSDELEIRLNVMFEVLGEEEMDCFVKDTLKRPLLNQVTLSALCKKLQKSITVLFDESVSSTARAQELITVVQTEEMIDDEDDEEKCCTYNSEGSEMIWDAAFWQLQKKLSIHSAELPTFAEACKFFRLDLKNIILRGIKLVLNTWQLTGAAWARMMKLGELLRGLISDDCGTGKMVLALLLIYFTFLDIEKEHDESIKHDYKPTFILCPSVITEVWWLKYLLYFSSLLTMKVWYDGWGDSKDPVMHNAILGKDVHDLHDYVHGLDSNNLNTIWVIIISFYMTVQSHSLKTYMVELSEKEKKKQAAVRIRDQGPVTESEERRESSQKEVNESIKYSMILEGLFERLILNECHKAKN